MDRVIFLLIKWIGGYDYFTQEQIQDFELGNAKI